VAVEELGRYRTAREKGDTAAITEIEAKFDRSTPQGAEFLREHFAYFGYGYLSSPEQIVPDVPLLFYSFRVMVGAGCFFGTDALALCLQALLLCRLAGGDDGGQGRHLGEQTEGTDLAMLLVVDVEGVVIEGGQRADHAAHDGHGVGVAAEAAEEEGDLLVHHGLAGDQTFKFRILDPAVRRGPHQDPICGI
jgi:hypothetical protein